TAEQGRLLGKLTHQGLRLGEIRVHHHGGGTRNSTGNVGKIHKIFGHKRYVIWGTDQGACTDPAAPIIRILALPRNSRGQGTALIAPQLSRRITIAVVTPPPPQMPATPISPLRVRRILSRVISRRPPLKPVGWPRAMAPPQTFTLARSHPSRSEEHTPELQSRENLVCRLLLV